MDRKAGQRDATSSNLLVAWPGFFCGQAYAQHLARRLRLARCSNEIASNGLVLCSLHVDPDPGCHSAGLEELEYTLRSSALDSIAIPRSRLWLRIFSSRGLYAFRLPQSWVPFASSSIFCFGTHHFWSAIAIRIDLCGRTGMDHDSCAPMDPTRSIACMSAARDNGNRNSCEKRRLFQPIQLFRSVRVAEVTANRNGSAIRIRLDST